MLKIPIVLVTLYGINLPNVQSVLKKLALLINIDRSDLEPDWEVIYLSFLAGPAKVVSFL